MSVIGKFFNKHKTGSILFGLILFSTVLISFSSNSVSFKPKEVGQSFFSFFQIVFSEIGDFFSDTVNSISELRRLKDQYTEVRDKLENYKMVERDLVELRAENRTLREQLNFTQSHSYNYISAEIIAKDPGNMFNTITVNKGEAHGIKINMAVIAIQDGYQGLVGKVVEVGYLTAKILPLYDNFCYVTGRLQESRYEGLINGSGDNREILIMRYIKKRAKDEIKYGDIVVTSGMGLIYPKGIIIGRIRNIGAPEWETSLILDIEPAIDFSRLEYLFILDQGDVLE